MGVVRGEAKIPILQQNTEQVNKIREYGGYI